MSNNPEYLFNNIVNINSNLSSNIIILESPKAIFGLQIAGSANVVANSSTTVDLNFILNGSLDGDTFFQILAWTTDWNNFSNTDNQISNLVSTGDGSGGGPPVKYLQGQITFDNVSGNNTLSINSANVLVSWR